MNRIITFAAVAALLAGACGKDQIVEPTYGDGCSKGTLALGDTLHGDLRLSTACLQDENYWDGASVLYNTYKVHFDAGKAYLIREQRETDSVGVNSLDAVLEIWGTDANGTRAPLGASDDEGTSSNSNRDSELWFVSPTTADYNLFTMNYGVSDSGGYRVSMLPCSVVATLDTNGTYTGLSLTAPPANGCLRHNVNGNTADSTGAALATMPLVANDSTADSVVVTVITTGGFQPAIEVGGPGFDVYDNIYTTSRFVSSGPTSTDTTYVGFRAAETGNYSVLVGAATYGGAGTFQIVFQKQALVFTAPRPVKALKAPPAWREKHYPQH
ncbi:MAG: hypothetical protein WBC97_06535 [Gemmatimonadales bacterium]